MDTSLFLGLLAVIIGFMGIGIGIRNLVINELNRHMASFRLAFDLKKFREEQEKKFFYKCHDLGCLVQDVDFDDNV